MTAPSVILRPLPPGPGRTPSPLKWLLGGAVALAATAVAAVLALLFAAALAFVTLLAFAVVLVMLAATKVARGRAAHPPVISARWTGCGWDAG